MTKNPEIRFAKSIVDYIFRWLATKFLSPEAQFRAGVNLREEPLDRGSGIGDQGSDRKDAAFEVRGSSSTVASGFSRTDPNATAPTKRVEFAAIQSQEDAPPCSTCGAIMIRSGSCYKCANCGTTSGCA
jgi:ribonucleoside-diphosphate reductase alpha chain